VNGSQQRWVDKVGGLYAVRSVFRKLAVRGCWRGVKKQRTAMGSGTSSHCNPSSPGNPSRSVYIRKCSFNSRLPIKRHSPSISSIPDGLYFSGLHCDAAFPSNLRGLPTVGRSAGSFRCQQAVVNSHSSSVYPREMPKFGFWGRVTLIICMTTT